MDIDAIDKWFTGTFLGMLTFATMFLVGTWVTCRTYGFCAPHVARAARAYVPAAWNYPAKLWRRRLLSITRRAAATAREGFATGNPSYVILKGIFGGTYSAIMAAIAFLLLATSAMVIGLFVVFPHAAILFLFFTSAAFAYVATAQSLFGYYYVGMLGVFCARRAHRARRSPGGSKGPGGAIEPPNSLWGKVRDRKRTSRHDKPKNA